MPQVPIIEPETQTRGLPTPQLTGYRGSAPQINVPQNGLTNLGKAVTDIAFAAKERADTVNLIEAQRKIDEWEATNLFDAKSGALARKGRDAFDLPNTLTSEYDKFTQDLRDGLTGDNVKLQFEKLALSRRDTVRTTLFNHERSEMNSYAATQAQAGISSSQNRAQLYYNNEDIVNGAIKSAQDVALSYARVQGLPENAIQEQMQSIESKTRLGVLSRMADTDTSTALEYYETYASKLTAEDLGQAQKLMQPVMLQHDANRAASKVFNGASPKFSQADMIEFVMMDLEGGDAVASEPNPGTYAQYGINSEHNADLADKIKKGELTKEEAIARTKSNYWYKDLDDMPADIRLVAFDMGFNGWDKKVLGMTIQEAIEDADYDARRLMETRAKYYDALVKNNPEKFQPVADGWAARLGKINNQLDIMRGKLPSEYELHNQIDAVAQDPDVAKAAKDMVSGQLKGIKAAREEEFVAASDEAWEYLNSGMEPPPSVIARMKPQDVQDMRNTGEPDPELYEEMRDKITRGESVNLKDFRWRLRGKYDELAKMQNDPSERANARAIDDVIKNNQGILLGKSSPGSAEEFKKIEAFRRAVFSEIEGYEKQGRTVTSDDVQRITDKLLMVSGGSFNDGASKKNFFQVQPGEKLAIKGIPNNRPAYYVGGFKMNYNDMIDFMIRTLEGRNKAVNEEELSRMYKESRSAGLITEDYR